MVEPPELGLIVLVPHKTIYTCQRSTGPQAEARDASARSRPEGDFPY